MIRSHNVTSSSIDQIATFTADDGQCLMLVRFKRGMVYLYEDVPTALANSIVNADSVGQAMQQVTNGPYKNEKIGVVNGDLGSLFNETDLTQRVQRWLGNRFAFQPVEFAAPNFKDTPALAMFCL